MAIHYHQKWSLIPRSQCLVFHIGTRAWMEICQPRKIPSCSVNICWANLTTAGSSQMDFLQIGRLWMWVVSPDSDHMTLLPHFQGRHSFQRMFGDQLVSRNSNLLNYQQIKKDFLGRWIFQWGRIFWPYIVIRFFVFRVASTGYFLRTKLSACWPLRFRSTYVSWADSLHLVFKPTFRPVSITRWMTVFWSIPMTTFTIS